MLASGANTRRTAKGRELWSKVGGFYRVLSTPSSQNRFDFSGRQDLYTAYIPWAVAFDSLGLFALVEMLLFMVVVFVAYAYVWRRGGLTWD